MRIGLLFIDDGIMKIKLEVVIPKSDCFAQMIVIGVQLQQN